MDDKDFQVSSEIFEENDYVVVTKKPILSENNVVSKFNFYRPRCGLAIDADGDLNVLRRNPRTPPSPTDFIEIEHKKSTVLGMVGLQVWRGAFLLADWLMHYHETIPKGSYVLELGSGVGFTSIVASMFFPVICTDVNRGDILRLIECNVHRNENHVKNPIEVLELDFTSDRLPEEIVKHLPNVGVIIAADTVYDDSLTEAFIRTIQRLLSTTRAQSSVYVALEKRYVFTVADCDTVAPCYDYYLECLEKLTNVKCEPVPLTFPQYFQYQRAKELVLWKVTAL
ncbi:unnamed protein product [Phyllotreta striolata]|uniref:Methyltransferase-like protein 22 n=1 Tax=Phyllotreta striolata TaxID=444603 RepID=A0A9N9TDD6_PHYSR|nr:unnamed protein product [Phyllotreta striolata]